MAISMEGKINRINALSNNETAVFFQFIYLYISVLSLQEYIQQLTSILEGAKKVK